MNHILAPFVRSAQGDNRNGDPQWRQWDAVSRCGEPSKLAEFAVPSKIQTILKVGGLWGLLLCKIHHFCWGFFWGVSTYLDVISVRAVSLLVLACEWTQIQRVLFKTQDHIGCAMVCESLYITHSKTHSTNLKNVNM